MKMDNRQLNIKQIIDESNRNRKQVVDFKKKDVESIKDGEIAVSYINGAIRLSEHEERVKLLRKKSQLVIAFGSCAYTGGIPGLGNFYLKDTIFQRVYKEVPTVENPGGITPQEHTAIDAGELTLMVKSMSNLKAGSILIISGRKEGTVAKREGGEYKKRLGARMLAGRKKEKDRHWH